MRKLNIDFRNESRKALKRAKAELASSEDDRLKYAALDLRLAMEALTYDRMQAYKKEIPEQEYETWQPRKVLQLLLEVDPNADKSSSLAYGLEEEPGKPAKEMKMLGSENVLNLATLKKHYDALGAYLHMPTLKQQGDGSHPDFKKLRKRCDSIAAALEKALASSVFNVTVGQFCTVKCSRCEHNIRKRMPLGKSEIEARCFNCGAEYIVSSVSEGQSKWQPIHQEIACPGENCSESIVIWRDEMKIGTWWTCHGCGGAFEICHALKKRDKKE